MRSYPSCWNKTLAQLGFRRKRRKTSKRQELYTRRSLFEILEQRQMLSGDPLLDFSSEETIVVAGNTQESFTVFSSQPEFFLIEKEYSDEEWKFLAEELDGELATELPSLFVVQTQQTEAGPKAILSFHPDAADSVPSSLQKIQLELRENGRALETYDILIDIAEESFRERFLSDRIEAVSASVATLDRQDRSDWLGTTKAESATEADFGVAVDPEVEYLMNFVGPLTLQQHVILHEGLTDDTDRLTKITDPTADFLTSLAKRQSEREDILVDDAERERFYSEIEKHAQTLKQDRLTAITDDEFVAITEREKSLRSTTLLLAKDLNKDLKSEDALVAQAALKLRDELVAISGPYETAFSGLGVDREIERKFTNSGDEKAVSFVETGRYVFNDHLEIDLGEHQAMVQVIRSSNLRFAALTSVSESPAVEDGFVDEYDDGSNGGTATSLHVDGTSGSLQESLIRFNLAEATTLSDPTTIASAALQLTEIGTGTGNAEVFVWNGLFEGPAGSVTDWDETNVNWIHIDEDLGFSQRVSEFTQVNNWTAGTTTEVDVTSQLQRALLFGDANGDGEFTAAGDDGDIEAFHLAVTNLGAYLAEYGSRAVSVQDLLARTDGGLGDGSINTSDISDFFRRHGFSQGDYNLDGTVQDNADSGIDGLDWAVFQANYGLTNAKFTQGDGDFDGVVDDDDFDIWFDRKGEDNLSSEEPEVIFWVRPEDATTDIEFASQEHTTLDGPTLVIEEQPDLALNRFSVEGSNLVVDYAVLGTDFSNVKVQLFKTGSPDVLVHETNVQSGSIGSHKKLIAISVLSSIVEGDSIYAKLVGTPSAGTQSNTANDQLDFEFTTASTQIINSLDDAGMDTLLRSKHTLRELLTANESLGWYDTLTFENSGLFDDGPGIITLGDLDQNNQADEIRIKEDLVIEGPGSHLLTIDARVQNRVFNISAGVTTTLSGFTITGGGDVTTGGGIYNAGDLTLQSVALIGNKTRYANASGSNTGGGIYSKAGGALRIFQSTIDGNHARWGGGVYFWLSGSNVLEIEGSTFSNNLGLGGGSSSDGLGGGLVVNSQAGATGDANITNSTFSGNLSKYAAGLSFRNDDTNAKLVNVTVTDNHTTDENGNLLSGGYAGGIQAWGPTGTPPEVTLHNTIVAGNTAALTNYQDNWGNLNGTPGFESSHNLIGVGFTGGASSGIVNGVLGNLAGSVAVPLDPRLAPLDTYGGQTLTHALFEDSPAIDHGNDAQAVDAAGNPLLVDQRGFDRVLDVVGIHNEGTDVVDIGAFEDPCVVPEVNRLDDVGVDGMTTLRQAINQARTVGGTNDITFDPALFEDGEQKEIVLSEQITIDNPVTILGPGQNLLFISGDNQSRVFEVLAGQTAVIEDVTITKGNSLEGGGIYNDGDLTLNRVNVFQNTAYTGGGIYSEGSLTVNDSLIDGNVATDRMGGVWQLNGDLTIERTAIINNHADDAHGGMAVSNANSVLIDQSTFAYNSAGQSAGLYILNNLSTASVHVQNTTISENWTDTFYGGLYLTGIGASPIVLTNVTVTENRAGNHTSGGISTNGSVPKELYNTIVAGNTNHGGTSPADVSGDYVGNSFSYNSAYNLIGWIDLSSGLIDLTTQYGGSSYGGPLDPMLSDLTDNGGPIRTHEVLDGSPALDTGSDSLASGLTTDQRGGTFQRIFDWNDDSSTNNVDLGAVEAQEGMLDLDTTSAEYDSSVVYVSREAPQVIAASAQLDGVFDAILVTITNRTDGASEVLSAAPTNSAIEVSYAGGVLTLSGVASVSDYEQALQSVTYTNLSESPDTNNRTITVELLQGTNIVATAIATVDLRIRATIELPSGVDFSNFFFDHGPIDSGHHCLFMVGSSTGSFYDNSGYMQFVLPSEVENALIENAEIELSTAVFWDPSQEIFVLPNDPQSLAIFEINDLWGGLSEGASLSPYLHDLVGATEWSTLVPTAIIASNINSRASTDITSSLVEVLGRNETVYSIGITDSDSVPSLNASTSTNSFWSVLASHDFQNADVQPALSVSGLFKNIVPVAVNDSDYSGPTHVPIIVDSANGVLANDNFLSELPLSAELVSGPAVGSLEFENDGSFTYIPNSSSTALETSFTYRAFNEISYSEEATVTITLNSAPSIQITPKIGWVMTPDGDGVDHSFESNDQLQSNPLFFPVGWYDTGVASAASTPESGDANETSPLIEAMDQPWDPSPDIDDDDPGSGLTGGAGGIGPGEWWFPEPKGVPTPVSPDYLGIPRKSSFVQFDLFRDGADNVDPSTVDILSAVAYYTSDVTDLTEFAFDDDDNPLHLTTLAQQSLSNDPIFRIRGNADNAVPVGPTVDFGPTAGDNVPYTGGFDPAIYKVFDLTVDAQSKLSQAVVDGINIDELLMTVSFEGRNLAAGSVDNVYLVVTYGEPEDPIPQNGEPFFTSKRITEVFAGEDYPYESRASDPDNDALSFYLDPHIEWPAGYTPAIGEGLTVVDQEFPYEAGVFSWTPAAELIGQTVTITEVVVDSAGHVVPRTIEILVKADPDKHAPEIINTAPDQFSILSILEPQVLGPDLDPVNPSLGVIEGQTWLDVNGDGVRNSLFAPALEIELAIDGTEILERNDDGFTATSVDFAGQLDDGTLVPFDFDFYTDAGGGVQIWDKFYVNNNGNITFGSGNGIYTPEGLDSTDPSFPARIAPFWADVDTNGFDSNTVSLARGMSPRGNPFVQIDWRDVGYFAGHTDKLNDFTLYIEDDIEGDVVAFFYRNMEWTTGDASDGYGGFGPESTGAQIGFAAGNGTDYIQIGVQDGLIVEDGPAPHTAEMLEPLNGTDESPVVFVFRIGPDGGLLRHVEPGADGFTVDLIDTTTGTVLATQISRSVDVDGIGGISRQDEMGLYRFVDVGPGDYEVIVRPRHAWQQTDPVPPAGQTVTITGTEAAVADLGFARLYTHDVEAIDLDEGDTLTYLLDESPDDATIDPVTGEISWLPRQAGDYPFTIRVEDDGKLFDLESFTLKVRDNTPNVLPVVNSTPPRGVTAGKLYKYRITAYDANLDPLIYEKVSGPAELDVDFESGVVRWETNELDEGSHPVVVRIIDAAGRLPIGEEVLEEFTVNVLPPEQNEKPVIESSPPLQAVVGQRYYYPVDAYDPEGTTPSYALITKPDGMEIQGALGYIYFDPLVKDVGKHDVVIRVFDQQGKHEDQSFVLEVFAENSRPRITSSPSNTGEDSAFLYRLEVEDTNGDPVDLSLQEAPVDMQLLEDTEGPYVYWEFPVEGTHPIKILADDGKINGQDVQEFDLVISEYSPPAISGQAPSITPINELYTATFTVTSNYSIADLEAGIPVAGNQVRLDQSSLNRGMQIDLSQISKSGGGTEPYVYSNILVKWTPAFVDTVSSELTVTVTIGTPGGDVDVTSTLPFEVQVAPEVNLTIPPELTNAPTGPAQSGAGWSFSPTATDPDGNDQFITVTSLEKPASANFDGTEFSWTPSAGDIGTNGHFAFKLTDLNGDFSIWEFDLPVEAVAGTDLQETTSSAPAMNEGPEVENATLGPFAKDQPVDIQLNVVDPNGHAVTSFLVDAGNTTAPDFTNANIDDSGRITWTPRDGGNFTITLLVRDEHQGESTVVIDVLVKDNARPKITTTPIPRAPVGVDYSHDFTIIDPNPDDTLEVNLNQEAINAGMSLDQIVNTDTWRLTWQNPAPSTVASYPVEITALDQLGQGRSLPFQLSVYDPTMIGQPAVPSLPSQIEIPAEGLFELQFPSEDGTQQLTYKWQNGFTPPSGVLLTSNGRLRWSPSYDEISEPVETLLISVVGEAETNNTNNFSVTLDVVDPNAFTGVFPTITSPPPKQATAGQEFVYTPTADYVGSITPKWHPVDVPGWLDLDPISGKLSGTPSDSLIGNTIDISIRAIDHLGFGNTQEFRLEIIATDQNPQFDGSLTTEWRVNQAGAFQVDAVDPEGHAVDFVISPMPQADPLPGGLRINEQGLIEWNTGDFPTIQTAQFMVRVAELHNPDSYTEQKFTLDVISSSSNLTPKVEDAPDELYATVADGYVNRYLITLSDPDVNNQGYTFSIENGPIGDMDIQLIPGSTNTAELTWTATATGDQPVELSVTDDPVTGTAKTTHRQFVLHAVENAPPEIFSGQVAEVAIGDLLTYRVKSDDAEDHALTYAFDESDTVTANAVADGLTINEDSGQIRWEVPTTTIIQDYSIVVLATDEFNATTSQAITVTVKTDDVAPTVSLQIIDLATGLPVLNGGKLLRNNKAGANNDYQLIIGVEDNYDIGVFNSSTKTFEVTTNSTSTGPINLVSSRSSVEFDPAEVGTLTITVSASDAAGNNTTESYTFFVADEASNAVAIITSPSGNEAITGPTAIYGTVDSDTTGSATATSYKLELIDSANTGRSFTIFETSVAVQEINNGELGTLDPTLFTDGVYRLRLSVLNGTSVLTVDEKRIEILNSLKAGDLEISFTDLSVNLSGIPLSITRSYDSKRSDVVGDFGYGWNLDLVDGKVFVDHPDRYVNNFWQEFKMGTRVYVRLSNGSVHSFTFRLGPGGKPQFAPDPGVTSRLSLTDEASHLYLKPTLTAGILYGVTDGRVRDNDGDPFVPAYWATDLRLTTRGGLNYHFDFRSNQLIGLSNQNGQRINIEDSVVNTGNGLSTQSITSEDGTQSVQIVRYVDTGNATDELPEADGLIKEIKDPNGNSFSYDYGTYDGAGTFTAYTSANFSPVIGQIINRALDKTYFTYDEPMLNTSTAENHLTGIHDDNDGNPIRILTVGYNELGRLNQLEDAAGSQADISFNLKLGDGRSLGRLEDDQGNFIDLVRDRNGNVLLRVIPIDPPNELPADPAQRKFLVTESVYDENDNLLRESIPFVVTGSANRYQQPASDPDTNQEAWARQLTYTNLNAGRLERSKDALGNVTIAEYDHEDRVIATTNPNGIISHKVYDRETGNLRETYSTDGKDGPKFNHSRFEYEKGQLTNKYRVRAGGSELLVSGTTYFSSDDHFGLPETTISAAGLVRYFGYDNNGNQTHSWYVWTDPNSPTSHVTLATLTSYDPEGRVDGTEEYELVSQNITDFSALKTEINLATVNPLSTTSTTYDSQGRALTSTDRYGAVSHTLYDIRGNVVESRSATKDAINTAWLITRTLYDDQGRVLFSADPYFVTTTNYNNNVNFDNDSLIGTLSIYDHLGRVTQTERHSNVQLDLTQSGEQYDVSLPTNFVWDDGVASSPDSLLKSFSSTNYSEIGSVEYTVNESGTRTDFYYDDTGRQIAVLAPAVVIGGATVRHLTESTFDPAGRLIRSDANIQITAAANVHPDIEDTANRDVTSMQSTYYEYDAAGRQTAVITTAIDDPDDSSPTPARIHLRTETVYDDLGRRTASREGIKQTDPFDGLTIDRSQQLDTNYEYSDSGNLTAVILPPVEHPSATIGLVRPRYEYVYDMYGNRTKIVDNVIHVSAGVGDYDHNDNLVDDARTTEFTYDHRGRQISRQLPEGVSAGDSSFQERSVFGTTLLAVIPTNDLPTSVANGQLEYSVDFEGRVTAYLYDNTAEGSGRLVRKEFFASEAAHTADTVTDRVTYTYDGFGRALVVDQEFKLDDLPISSQRITSNSYNAEGRLLSVATDEATIHYEYAIATGLLVRTYTTDGIGSNVRTDVRYVHDNLRRLSNVIAVELVDIDVEGSAIDWIDAAGNTIPIDGDVTQYSYDLTGNLSRLTLSNGVTVDHTYDELNRLTKLVNYVDNSSSGTLGEFDAADALKSSFEYEVDLFHKRTSVLERINNGTTIVESQIDWVYDSLGRLTQEDYDYDTTSGNEAHDFVADYSFDLVGNRLGKEVDNQDAAGVEEVFTYEYDDNDRLLREEKDVQGTPTGDTTTFYGYQETLRTSKTVYDDLHTTEPATGETSVTTFEYNLQGRMSKATIDADGVGPDGNKVSTYEYGDDGIRISQTVDGVTTLYVVDKNNPTGYAQVLEEGVDDNQDGKLNDDEIDKSYVIGHDVIAQAAKAGANLVIQYLMYDGHGSTRAVLDDNAEIIEDGVQKQLFAYDAYGNLIAGPGLVALIENAITTLLYSGEQTDAATGLQYLRARYYASLTGTFNRVDPFAGNFNDPQSLHKYLYTHGDPVGGIDPSGEILGWLLGGLVVGAAFAFFGIGASLFSGAAGLWAAGILGGLLLGVLGGFLFGGANVSVSQDDVLYADDPDSAPAAIDAYSVNNRKVIDNVADPENRQRLLTVIGTIRGTYLHRCRTNTCLKWLEAARKNVRALPKPYWDNNEYIIDQVRFDTNSGPATAPSHGSLRVKFKNSNKVVYFDQGWLGDTAFVFGNSYVSGGIYFPNDLPGMFDLVEEREINRNLGYVD